MGGRPVTRTLALASTTRGFAFIVLEDATRLVDWGIQRCPPEDEIFRSRIDALILRYRPMVGAIESLRDTRKRKRGRTFIKSARALFGQRGVLVAQVPAHAVRGLTGQPSAKKWDVVVAVSKRFPELSHRLPRRRRPWESEDVRVGLFIAGALALCASVGISGEELR